jgi:hypothetical protein
MGINLGLILGVNIWECIRMKLGLILGVIDLRVYWGKFGINFGCVRFEGVSGTNVGSILDVKFFGDAFGKKIETNFGIDFGCSRFEGCFETKFGTNFGRNKFGLNSRMTRYKKALAFPICTIRLSHAYIDGFELFILMILWFCLVSWNITWKLLETYLNLP